MIKLIGEKKFQKLRVVILIQVMLTIRDVGTVIIFLVANVA